MLLRLQLGPTLVVRCSRSMLPSYRLAQLCCPSSADPALCCHSSNLAELYVAPALCCSGSASPSLYMLPQLYVAPALCFPSTMLPQLYVAPGPLPLLYVATALCSNLTKLYVAPALCCSGSALPRLYVGPALCRPGPALCCPSSIAPALCCPCSNLPELYFCPSSLLPWLYVVSALRCPCSMLSQQCWLYVAPLPHYTGSTLFQLYVATALCYPGSNCCYSQEVFCFVLFFVLNNWCKYSGRFFLMRKAKKKKSVQFHFASEFQYSERGSFVFI